MERTHALAFRPACSQSMGDDEIIVPQPDCPDNGIESDPGVQILSFFIVFSS
mgnify:CR=1 FL=1